MRMIASKRRSSFGTNCFQCDNELIAPERSEYRDERQIRHLWQLLFTADAASTGLVLDV